MPKVQDAGTHQPRRGRRVASSLAEINVVPLVDVMLVLLIIFMVTAPLLTPGVKVDLPKASSAKSLNPKAPLIVSVGRDGHIAFGADEVSLDALGPAVKAKLGDDPAQVEHIRGDKDAPFGEVVKAMDRLTLAGVTHIAIVTAPGAKPPEPAK